MCVGFQTFSTKCLYVNKKKHRSRVCNIKSVTISCFPPLISFFLGVGVLGGGGVQVPAEFLFAMQARSPVFFFSPPL